MVMLILMSVMFVMLIQIMIVKRIVLAFMVAVQIMKPIISTRMVMDLDLVMKVHFVMLLFHQDGLQTMMTLSRTV